MSFPRLKNSPPARVVVTGAGIVTALGCGWKSNAEGFRTGRAAFRPVTLFDVTRQRVKMAAEADLPAHLPKTRLTGRHLMRLDRAARLLLLASAEAWREAGWVGGENIPVVLGTTSAGMSLGETYYRQAIEEPRSRRHQATRVMHYQAQRQGLDVTEAFGFNGPITIIANACASGANAIGHAFELIRNGSADRAFTGGYDALSQLVFAGFDSLQALSPTRCRPFDLHRDGLALGEGAAMFALESLSSAQGRNANILAEIVGYGATTDSHHLTQPHPQGDAAYASMNAACQQAQLRPEQIGYLNAHGTGTALNDSAEALAINRWSENNPQLHVSSTKASIGHLLGAAGAVETAVCLMVLQEQWLPPTLTIETRDPICQFQLVTEPREKKVNHALTNSFGFGGSNASLIFRRWA